ncbi:ligand-binding sensor domain-containing protein [Larkinella soli]|uniref:ligand-binding sensor domain-containing protein n=1 Tax=Larkinella soli TaxID=1770527 RepID=UPI000FFB8A01|nr:two-component regulator propeller domain-containing protein [Larkinella soli]
MKYAPIYALFLITVFHTSCGQNQTNVSKDNIKSETTDTLTSTIWDIKQDRNGNIWFAASDGVFRYDGKLFTKITGILISKPFFSILEDRKGNFWFGTSGSGVFYYDGKSFQNFTTREGLVNNSVMPIFEDKDGIIWLGTGGGVSRYDGKSFQNFTTSDGLTNNDVHDIVQDKTGKIWFGTRGDISVYDGKTFTTLTDKDGKTFRNVWAIIKDKKGNIWFGADGLWRYDGSAFTQIDQTGAGVIIEDEKGNVLTSIGGPIFRYDEQSLSNKKPYVTVIRTKYEGRSNLPFGMLWANDGSIWIGSDRYRYDGKTLTDFKESQK